MLRQPNITSQIGRIALANDAQVPFRLPTPVDLVDSMMEEMRAQVRGGVKSYPSS